MSPIQPALPADAILVGGPGAAFATIQAALDAAPAGGTIYVAAGTYDENLTITKKVTLLGANQGIPGKGLRGPESLIRGLVWVGESAGDIQLDGLMLAPSAAAWKGTNLRIESATSTLSNTIITSGKPTAGGYTYPSFISYSQQRTRIEIEGNLFNGLLDALSKPTVVRIFGSDEALIKGNLFSFSGSGGSSILGTSHYFRKLEIEDNLISGGADGFFYYNQPNWTGNIDQLNIRNNALTNLLSHGIYFGSKASVSSAVITGNILATNASSGAESSFVNISVLDPAQTGSNLQISGNLIVNPWDPSQRFSGFSPKDPNESVPQGSPLSSLAATVLAASSPAMTAPLPLANAVDRERFSVTLYAASLGFPSSMTTLEDGSILVAVTDGDPSNHSPFGSTNSHLVRLPDIDGNGISDGTQVLATLPGFVTSVRRVGDLVIALSTGRAGQKPCITIWRTGKGSGNPSTDPLQMAGRLNFDFPAEFLAGDDVHTSYALAARYSPNQVDQIELYFNIGSSNENRSTDPSIRVGLSAGEGATFASSQMEPDSIQRVVLRDLGSTISISGPKTIARGLRNAAGLAFDSAGNLYFEDNGFSIDPDNPSATTDLNISFSADELNRINASELGNIIPDFGFGESYVRSKDGVLVNPSDAYRKPLISFLPVNGNKSEGAVEISPMPSGFPGEFTGNFLTNFFGKFGVGTAKNDENPVVISDPSTGKAFHFIQSSKLGNPSGLLASGDALYLADYSSSGIFFGGSGAGAADQSGVIYRITPKQKALISTAPILNKRGSTSATVTWGSSNDVICSLELWGGIILQQSPRVITIRPTNAGSDWQASALLDGLQPETTYQYRVVIGDQTATGTFTTLPSAPALKWIRQYGSSANDSGRVVISEGNSIFVGGAASGSWDGTSNKGGEDGFTTQLDQAGNLLETQWFGSSRNDQVRGIVSQPDALFLAGATEGLWQPGFPAGTGDGFVQKIASGTSSWLKIIGGDSEKNGYEMIHGSTKDNEHNIYVIGYSASASLFGVTSPTSSAQSDAFLARINSQSGSVDWLKRIDFGSWDFGMNLKISDFDGYLYATGFSQTSDSTYDIFLTKRDRSTGQEIWTQALGSAGKEDFGQDLAIGNNGQIVVAVSTDGDLDGFGNRGDRDIALIKFDTDGKRLWTTQIGSAGFDESRAVVAALGGGYFVTGNTKGSFGGQTNLGGDDAFISRLSEDGKLLWTSLIASNADDNAWSMARADNGEIVIAGETGGSLPDQISKGGKDVFLARIGDGDQLTSAPAAPSFFLATDTGSSNSDGITSNGTITVSGIEPAALWQYSTNGGSSWLNGSGSSFTLTPATYPIGAILLRQTDLAGHPTGTPAQNATPISVDATAPAAPTFALTSDTGSSSSDGVTSNGSITVSGVESNATWEYSTNSGTAWTTGSGSSFTLAAGSYAAGAIKVRQTDLAGNVTATPSQNTAAITVDATAPAAPSFSLATDSGSSNSDGVTNVGTVTVSGVETNATWEYSTNSGTAWTTGSGSSFTLAAGSYAAGAIKVRQTDLAGNVTATPSQNTAAITIDATAPAAPSFSLATDSGSSNSDGVTNVGTVTVSGVETNATWEYSTNSGTAWTTGSGSSFTLAAGSYAAGAIKVRQTDLAGNVTATPSQNATPISVDATAANEPVTISMKLESDKLREDEIANFVYTLSRTGPIDTALTVRYSITGSVDGTDVVGISGGNPKTITIAPGLRSTTLTLDPTADSIYEQDETITLTLLAGTGYTVTLPNPVVATILNDDPPANPPPPSGPLILLAISPADDTRGVPTSTSLVLDFSQAIQAANGRLLIRGGDRDQILSLDPSDAAVCTISGSKAIFHLANKLQAGMNYSITILGTPFTDLASQSWAGFKEGHHDFSTAAALIKDSSGRTRLLSGGGSLELEDEKRRAINEFSGDFSERNLAQITTSIPLTSQGTKLLDRYVVHGPSDTRPASDNTSSLLDLNLNLGQAGQSTVATIKLATEVNATASLKIKSSGEVEDNTYDPRTDQGVELLDSDGNGLVDTLRIHLRDGSAADDDGVSDGRVRTTALLAEAPRRTVYRFYNQRSGVHFYTPDAAERDNVIRNSYGAGASYEKLQADPRSADPLTGGWGYKLEGTAYEALDTQGTALYRFYNAEKRYHFLTTSAEEANTVIRNSVGAGYDLSNGINKDPIAGGWGYKYEGSTYKVSTIAQHGMDQAVYRFFNASKGVHFYTASAEERDNVIRQSIGAGYVGHLDQAGKAPLLAGGWGYRFEGTAWYV